MLFELAIKTKHSMKFDIEEWYKDLNKGDIILSHYGNISASGITVMLDKIEQEVNERAEKSKLRKRVHNVMIEALQNLYHHTDNPPKNVINKFGKNFATFVLKKESENNYSFTSGNFIDKNRIKSLKDRMDQINYLTSEELKILYKLILNNDEFSDKGGGGLGLVDIAKRTGHEYNYTFNNYTDDFYFFCLTITIST
ncbi:MAG: hypothetical protein DRJ10_15915 [Bacteroidetes bacterium]|nr:MAG: hypothetical protein DRJ10_15915 [Bacteroidota bacterium]